MSINLEKAQSEFLKYTENYDLNNEHIKAKQQHSLRVIEISKKIAQGLGLPCEEIELATIIGLLHDVARFEQYTIYGTFKDIESIDHGDFGAQILEKDIRKYIEKNEYDGIIIKAVKNHNKFKIEEGLTEKELLFAKIIRDADKIDILYQSVVRFWRGNEQMVENSVISEDVITAIQNLSQVKRRKGQTAIDNVISVIAFIFDLNFKSSFQILKEEDYINFLNKNISLYLEQKKKIYLFSFCSYEGDEKTIQKLYKIRKDDFENGNISIVKYNGDIDKFLYIYQQMEYMICERFHSLVLSYLFGHKFFVISYSKKIDNIITELNLCKNEISDISILERVKFKKLELLDFTSFREWPFTHIYP